MRSTCHWNGHCICMPHPVVTNGKPWSPFCSISFNKPSTSGATSHTEKFSAFSTNFHSWRSKLSYTWQQHTHFKPCINILQLLLWKKSCITEKNPPTEILVRILFSVFEMLSQLHKIYSYKALDFTDIKSTETAVTILQMWVWEQNQWEFESTRTRVTAGKV